MAEEQSFESQETHRLCANNCGFFGSSSTLNLCSKCYRDHRLKEEQASSAKLAVEASLAASSSSSPTIVIRFDDQPSPVALSTGDSSGKASDLPVQDGSASGQPNRCLTCKKKVGLTGFRCRCGIMFCSSHRYPEKHGCTFDFKTAGKEAIAKANPVVKGDKVQRI